MAELPEFGDPYALPTPARGQEPTPARGQEPTPARGQEPTPARGQEQTPARGQEPAPARRQEPTPVPAADHGVVAFEPAPDSEPPLLPEPKGAGTLAEESQESEPADPAPSRPFDLAAQSQPHGETARSQPHGETMSAEGPASRRPPAEPAGLAPPTSHVAADRPTRGSIADLQARLTTLPDGHPSALYDEAGRVRPAPTRLRHLELGLPAPERSLPAGLASYPERFGFARADADPDDADGSVASEDSPSEGAIADGGAAAVALSAGADVRQARPDPNGNGHRGARADRQDPYAVGEHSGRSGNGATRATPLGAPWPAADARDTNDGSGNGHRERAREPDLGPDARPPRLPRRDADSRDTTRHDTIQFDTGRTRAVQHPADVREGPQPSPAERPRRDSSLPPQYRELVGRILAACRAADGRTAFGSYGSSGLTPALQRIAAQLPAGGMAPGSDRDVLKPADRFAAKLARLIARQPGRAPEELAASISDAIRYAFMFDAADYSECTWLVHRKLKAQGFELEARRNQWDSREYKGVFTRWRDPAHGLVFEVQFHTTESWAVVKQTHDAYVRITDPATPPAERARLRASQASATAAVQSPPGSTDIADYRSAAT